MDNIISCILGVGEVIFSALSTGEITSFILGILGTISGILVTHKWKKWQAKKGDLTGDWHQFSYHENGEVEKKDLVRLDHNHITKRVSGKINRLSPQDQYQKKWMFEGILRGNIIFMIFWSTDLEKNPGSYGTIQLYEENEALLTGFYIRPFSVRMDSSLINELQETKLEWKKVVK